MTKELINFHFDMINHSMRRSDLGTFIFIKVIFTKDQLNTFKLLYPDLLRKVAERSVKFILGNEASTWLM